MDIKDKIHKLFKSIDNMDTEKFLSFMTDDAVFRYGNAPAAKGKDAIRDSVNGFFSTIKALKHRNVNMWVHPEHIIYEGEVTYTRHDNSQLTVPFTNIFGMNGELVNDYRIYIDISPLYSLSS
ncbi:MAG: nuclear transport factor 2 family protein [Ignavibacteria bacterium]